MSVISLPFFARRRPVSAVMAVRFIGGRCYDIGPAWVCFESAVNRNRVTIAYPRCTPVNCTNPFDTPVRLARYATGC